MQKIYQKLFKNILSTALTVVISCLAIVLVVYAATTISANISTGGTLSVTGLSTFSTATSTSATSTAYLYVGPDFTEDANMNFTGGDLFVADALNVGGVVYLDGALQATSTALFTGAVTFYSTVNVVGLTTLTTATSTSATSTAYVYVGPDFTEDANMNFSGGDLFVADALNVGGVTYLDGALQATSTALFTGAATFYGNVTLGDAAGDTLTVAAPFVWAANTITYGLDLNSATVSTADLRLSNGETIGNLTNNVITFNSTSLAMATSTATTTAGVWVNGPAGTATSSVIVGGGDSEDAIDNTTPSGCFELWREGVAYRIYINGTMNGLTVEAGRCN